MAAFDVLQYMQTLESMLRITEQTWLLDEDFLQVLDKLSKVLGITKTEINIRNKDDEESEILTLYDDKSEAEGLAGYEFAYEKRPVRVLIYTKCGNSEYPTELSAGRNTVYEILRRQTIRELNRRDEEARGKTDFVTGVSTKKLFTEYVDQLYKKDKIFEYGACGFSLKGMAELNHP